MSPGLIAIGIVVLVSSAAIDYTHVRYAAARDAGQRWCAAHWSAAQWAAASISFLVAVKVSVWLLPFEALGLWLGTFVAVKPSRP